MFNSPFPSFLLMPDTFSPSSPRFRIAICGGGIGGLALGSTLGHYEHPGSRLEMHMYEAGPEITTVGAGISVWTRTWQIMRLLGLYDDLAGAAVEPPGSEGRKPGFTFRRADHPGESYEFGQIMVPLGSTTMHRADMVDVLVRSLPSSCAIHTSKRLLRYSESVRQDKHGKHAYITLYFADGTTAETDVLVGADGIKSATRAAMYDYAHAHDCRPDVDRANCSRCAPATPKWTGTVGYRCLIPSEKLLSVNPEHPASKRKAVLCYSGKEKHIISYPISHGRYINWIGFVTIPDGEGTSYNGKWVKDVPKEELVEHFAEWNQEVQEMLQCVNNPSLWAIHVIDSLPFSVSGRVALMGDAVHAMTTHFGAGAGQAIEDAYILGRLLAHPLTTLSHVPDVFRIYESVRLPYANNVVRLAREAGLMYEFSAPGHYGGERVAGEPEKLKELSEAMQRQWEWQWQEPFDAMWERAETAFVKLVREREQSGGRKWYSPCRLI